MSELVRTSLSLEKDLFDSLDALIEDGPYNNRSEFIRDLIRDRLVQKEWSENVETVGTLTLIYDHHKRNLSRKLTSIQHDHHDIILASTHVHLDHHLCAEAIILKGRANRLQEFSDHIRREKGVLHASLSMGSTGRNLPT